MGEPVKVHIYDLSKGMARSMSQAFLGKQIDGIWHTGIVVYGQEFFFGGLGGIESCNPGGLQMLGPPDEIVEVGKTEIPFEVFMDHLRELGTTTFRGDRYHLLDHNCNSFSNELALFLTGNPIPSKITSLPHEVMSTPFGAMIRPMLDSMQVTPGGHQMFPETTSSATNFPNTTMTSTNAAGSGTLAQNQYFPKTSYYTFDTANIKAILGKLKEFGGKVTPELQVREVLIDQLEEMAEGKEHRLEQLNTLQKLLQWPTDLVFPVLDILRLAIRHTKVNQHFCSESNATQFIEMLLEQLLNEASPSPSKMLVLRTLCNTFQDACGEQLLLSYKDKIAEAVLKYNKDSNKNIQIAASSVMLNFAVLFHNQKNSKAKHRCLSVVDQLVLNQTDTEADFRLLVCIGTLLHGDDSSFEFFKYSTENLAMFVKKCLEVKDPSKVKECADFLVALVKANPV